MLKTKSFLDNVKMYKLNNFYEIIFMAHIYKINYFVYLVN